MITLKCAIISSFYYIENESFDYNKIVNFVNKINSTSENLEFCNIETLEKLLNKINTRLIDRQSLSLEAAIKVAEDTGFLNDINKTELCVISGSYSSSTYPSTIFNLSTKKKGPNFVNATEFTNTVGNAAVSRACIWNQFRGCAYAISEGINSGLNAIVDGYKNIKYKNAKDILACATEEIGAAAILIRDKDELKTSRERPIAYIENVDSRYIGNVNNIENYLKNIEEKFEIKLKDTDIYLSGDIKNVRSIFEKNNINTQNIIKTNMWSLNPIVDIGRCLFNYSKGANNNSFILSIDNQGMVSSVLLSKGGTM